MKNRTACEICQDFAGCSSIKNGYVRASYKINFLQRAIRLAKNWQEYLCLQKIPTSVPAKARKNAEVNQLCEWIGRSFAYKYEIETILELKEHLEGNKQSVK